MSDKIEMIDKAKEFLKGYKVALGKIKTLEYQIIELRTSQMGTSIKYSDMPKGTNISDLSDYAAKLDELIRKYKEEQSQCIAVCNTIVRTIHKLPDSEVQEVLICRYINRMRWEDIENEIHVGHTTVHRLHKKGLEQVGVLITYSKKV